jgi:hypothetical protein
MSSSLSSESSLGSTGEGRNNTGEATPETCSNDDKKKAGQLARDDDEIEEIYDMQVIEPIFNASFGGYRLNGEAAMMKTLWQPPQRMSRRSRLSLSSSVSSTESELAFSNSPPLRTTSPSAAGGHCGTLTTGITYSPSPALSGQQSPPLSSIGSDAAHWLKFTAFDEVRSFEKTVAELEPPHSDAG